MATAARRMTVQAPNWKDDPKLGYPDAAAFLAEVIEHGHGTRNSERLRFLATIGSDEAAGYSDPAGGFLMPEGLAPEVLRVPPSSDPMAAVREVEMVANLHRIPARVDKDHGTSVTGGIVVARSPETVAPSGVRGELERIALMANELIGVTYASEQVAQDAPMFGVWLQQAFLDAMTDTLREERLRGKGVGECLGVLNSPCLITAAADAGQQAKTVTTGNVLRMISRCWGDAPTWIAHPELRGQLSALSFQPTGAALYRFAEGEPGTDGERDRLAGRPVFYDERASAPGDVGDLVLGAWSEYLSGTYIPPGLLSSIHVRFVQAERAVRFYQRGDGQPWWRSALTPRYGTNTLSPFVTLAAR